MAVVLIGHQLRVRVVKLWILHRFEVLESGNLIFLIHHSILVNLLIEIDIHILLGFLLGCELLLGADRASIFLISCRAYLGPLLSWLHPRSSHPFVIFPCFAEQLGCHVQTLSMPIVQRLLCCDDCQILLFQGQIPICKICISKLFLLLLLLIWSLWLRHATIILQPSLSCIVH